MPGNNLNISTSVRGAAAVTANLGRLRDRWTSDRTFYVGPDTDYAIYVEFGTSKMAAQPYMRPAVEHARRNLNTILSNASGLADALETIATTILRKAKEKCPVDTGRLRASISIRSEG